MFQNVRTTRTGVRSSDRTCVRNTEPGPNTGAPTSVDDVVGVDRRMHPY